MKKIYCIEEWIPENDGKPVNDLELLSTEYLSSLEILSKKFRMTIRCLIL